jgi:hypothetical protein
MCSTPKSDNSTRILFGSGPAPPEEVPGVLNLSNEFQSVSLNQPQSGTSANTERLQQYEKQMIGETLFPQIQAQEPVYARKITGMLLEGMDNVSLSKLIAEPNLLTETINEALRQYKEAVEPEKQQQLIGEQLYNKVKSSVNPEEQPLADKITGMLLGMCNNQKLLHTILESPDAFSYYIKLSIEVLQREKQNLGEALYPKVQLHTTNATKVTGMLLELDPCFVRDLLNCPFKLKEKVEECLSILGANDLVINFVTPRHRRKR